MAQVPILQDEFVFCVTPFSPQSILAFNIIALKTQFGLSLWETEKKTR